MIKIEFSAISSVMFGLCLFSGLAMCGCSEKLAGRPKVVPVTGAVAYNGNAIEGATVAFFVNGSPRAATGLTDKKGEFKLSTFAINDGCVAGDATITVSKAPPLDPKQAASGKNSLDPSAMANMGAERAKQKSNEKPIIPIKYNDMLQTPLKETVKPTGENRFVLQLKD